MSERQPRAQLPSALGAFEQLTKAIGGRRPAVFLDYDGVLTPIVSHPDLALMPEDARAVVRRLASITQVAVISGRDTADVRDKVALDGVWYAGSHGFDIVGPHGTTSGDGALDRFEQYIPPLIEAADEIDRQVSAMPGVHVERKRFAVAVHFREAADDAEDTIERVVREIGAREERLRVTTGKKIFELRPSVEWDKGKALEWLMGRLGLDLETIIPLYLGDDVTDEDAFAVLVGRGLGIVVGRDGAPTLAEYALEDPDEVHELLARLAGAIER
jgi:trehalose-phosphatase